MMCMTNAAGPINHFRSAFKDHVLTAVKQYYLQVK